MSPVDPADHIGLAIHLARRHTPRGHDVMNSEALGDGLLGLVRAAPRADYDRPEEAHDYLAAAIQNAIRDGVRRLGIGQDQEPGDPRGAVPFTDLGQGQGVGVWDHRRGEAAGPEERDLVCWLLGRLGERERRLVERVVMGGWSLEAAAAAEEPVITRERVRQIVAKALRKLKRAAEAMERVMEMS